MEARKVKSEVEAHFRLAEIWRIKGKLKSAIEHYKEAIRLQPNFIQAYQNLAQIFFLKESPEEAICLYKRAVELNPNEAELHKDLVNAFAKLHSLGGFDEAFEHYRLERKGSNKVVLNPSDILCCVVVRNESIRLPYFLSYYRQKGVDKFFIVDDDSTDDTLSYLLNQKDVYTWHSKLSFNRANFGSAWFEVVLRKYGLGHWCLIVDVDEILYYPGSETKSISQLCGELDQRNKKAFNAIVLDMYSDKATTDTRYRKGQSFKEVCPYFDKKFYHKKEVRAGPYKNQTDYYGGVRQRVFGEMSSACLLTKIPLIKYDLDTILTGGQHYTNIPPDKIASERGCLLHFEFLSPSRDRIEHEVARGGYYDDALGSGGYAKVSAQDHALNLYNENHSIKLKDTKQLIELGILKTGERKNVLEVIPPPTRESGTRKRHILLYTDCPIPYGAQIIAHGLVSKLIKRGNQVTWVQHKASHHLIEERIQLGIEHLWLENDNIYVALNQARAFMNISEAESIYNKANPDMIVFNDGSPVSSLAAKQVAIRMGIPYMTIVHQVWSDHAKLFSPYLDRLPETYRHAKEVIAVSNENLRLLHQFFDLPADQGRVIYNGIAAEFFTERNPEASDRLRRVFDIPSNSIICLTVARMDPDKGYQFQLSSIQQLKPMAIWPNLLFVWAGTGSLSNRLKAIAAELGVSGQIKFLGERTDIPDLLDAADIFILPSHYEGMPLAIMEAMAKGVPVIATGVSGTPEELGDTGKLLPDPRIDAEATISELTNTIQTWAVNPQLRQSVGTDCKKRAEKMFRVERMEDEYLSIIEKILLKPNESHRN